MSWSEESPRSGKFRNIVRVKLPNAMGKNKFELYLGKDRERPLAGVVSGRLCKANVYVKRDDIINVCVGRGTETSVAYGDKERLYVVIGTPEKDGDEGNPILININFYTFASLKMLNALAWFIDLGVADKKIAILPDICPTNPKFNGYSVSVDGQFVKGKYSNDELKEKGIYKNTNVNVRNRKRDELIDELFEYVSTSKLLESVYEYKDQQEPEDEGTAFVATFNSAFDDDTPPDLRVVGNETIGDAKDDDVPF